MIWVDTKEHGRIEAESLDDLLRILAEKVIIFGDVNIICGSKGLSDPLEFGKKIEMARRQFGATDV